jgi:hypothetical protein
MHVGQILKVAKIIRINRIGVAKNCELKEACPALNKKVSNAKIDLLLEFNGILHLIF